MQMLKCWVVTLTTYYSPPPYHTNNNNSTISFLTLIISTHYIHYIHLIHSILYCRVVIWYANVKMLGCDSDYLLLSSPIPYQQQQLNNLIFNPHHINTLYTLYTLDTLYSIL